MKFHPFVILVLAVVPLAGCAEDGASGGATPPTTTTTTSTPATAPAQAARADDFESAATGSVPPGWKVSTGNWSVVANASAPKGERVLLSDQTTLGETTILHEAAGVWGDLEARVMFNVLAGEKGQAGGIIFRYEDEGNYYVARYNHNELSWNLFRTIDGKREKFPGTDEGAEAFHGALHQWTELKVEARGAHIVVYSGDTEVVDYTEEDPAAPARGKIGLWTRYDSKTQFDDFSVGSA